MIVWDSKLENPNRELKGKDIAFKLPAYNTIDSKLENPNRELKDYSVLRGV